MATYQLPSTQSAIKIKGPGEVLVESGCPLPKLQLNDALVHVAYVSLNPADAKSVDMSASPGATSGCDFSGIIVALEGNTRATATPSNLSVGDRVCGCVFGNNPFRLDNGAFAEYVAVPARLLFKIPSGMSFQSAATLGTGLATVGLALYHGLKLPYPGHSTPSESPRTALVYGGGTATGAIAIQMLKLSGFAPITTCSPRSFERAKALGATATFDYRSPTCGSDIREYTKNNLAIAIDCITDTASMKICYEAIGSAGGQYIALDPFPLRVHTRRSIKPDWVFMFTQFNQHIGWQRPYDLDPRPEDQEFAERWYEIAQKLLDEGKVEPHPHQEESGRLKGVIDGMDAVRKGKVLGHKLVYSLSVT